MTKPPEVTCAVCGESAGEPATALCGVCDRPFHLNQRNDVEGKDCGIIWIDEQFLSLRFACFNCLPQEGATAGEGEPPLGEGH